MTKAREIAELGQKLTVDGSGNLDIAGNITSDGFILGNNDTLIFQDSNGTNRNILQFTTSNNIVIGGAGAGVNDITLKNNGAKDRLKVAVTGDISFYEDTGTTAKFFWDASAERLGLGTTSPSVPVHISGYAGTGLRLETTASNGGGNNFIDFYNQDGRTGYIGYGSGSQDSLWIWNEENHNVYIGANNFEAVRVTPSATLINEQGYNRDFRIESDNAAHMLFVDASADKVGIKTASPSRPLTVQDNNVQLRLEALSNPSGYYTEIGTRHDYNQSFVIEHKTHTLMEFSDGSGLKLRGDVANGVGNIKMYADSGATDGKTGVGLTLTTSNAVFNDSGQDKDFRVESDSRTHALFVDGSADTVGINTSTPSYDLDVNGATRTRYSIPAYTSTTGTSSSSNYWKIGTVSNLVGSRSLKIRILGTSSYSPGNIAGETTILFRGNNSGTTTNGTFWSETSGNNHIAGVAWKQTGTNDQFDIWVKWASSFAGTDIFVETAGQWTFDVSNTGSPAQPSGATGLSPRKATYVGDKLALDLQSTAVTINDTSNDMDFRVESNGNTHMFFVDGGQNLIGIGQSANFHGNRLNIEKSDSQTDGPEIVLKNLYQASSGEDELGSITFGGWRDVSDTGSYVAAIAGYDATYPGTSGQLRFFTKGNGNTDPSSVRDDAHEMMRITDDEVILNEHSTDNDFRVESDSKTHALHVDAGNNIVRMDANQYVTGTYSGGFNGGWQNVVNLDSIPGVGSQRGMKIRVHANENGRTNTSYGEWIAVSGNSTSVLVKLGQAINGNSHGTAQLQMSGHTLQIKNGATSSIGSWAVYFEVMQGA